MGKIESGIVTAICEELTYRENTKKLAFIRNNSGAVPTAWNTYVRFGKKGSADILIFLPNGKTVFVEAKAPGKKQSKEQIKFQALVEKLGYEYHLVYKPSDIDEIIK